MGVWEYGNEKRSSVNRHLSSLIAYSFRKLFTGFAIAALIA
jgi:hypothetical protein